MGANSTGDDGNSDGEEAASESQNTPRDRPTTNDGQGTTAEHTPEERKISAETLGEMPSQTDPAGVIAEVDPTTTTTPDTPSVDPMLAVYRHDVHKMQFTAHEHAATTLDDIPVNEPVPLGADQHAARLSRPAGDPEQTVANHDSPYRLSLLSGEVLSPDRLTTDVQKAVRELIGIDDPEAMHREWLNAVVPSLFNESVYYPYTSLKYHTLLAAALLSIYRDDEGFEAIFLVIDPPNDDNIVPHRTILAAEQCQLRLTTTLEDRPAASLGASPARSWADVWARLPDHPFDTDGNRTGMVLDAQLRRIRSWSTALQYIEDAVIKWGERL